MTSALFEPIHLRGLTLPNRIVVSPMCQYSAVDGDASDWHLIHLGHLALGGAGLLILEATAVDPVGRITPDCLGLWSDANEIALRRVLDVDWIDASSGGVSPRQSVPVGPGYQVPLAAAIRSSSGIPTIAVGLITEPHHAEEIIASGQADMVALARGMLFDPRWAWHAAAELGATAHVPPQYWRAAPAIARGALNVQR